MINQLDKTLQEVKIRNYNPKTIKSYTNALKKYFKFKKNKLNHVNIENIKNLLLYCKKGGISAKTQNQYLNAIKFYYRNVVGIEDRIKIRSAKSSRSLPVILTKTEIKSLIDITINPKHKLILSIAYSSGLMVSKVVNIKVKDINLENLTLHVNHAKGNKDRITIFPKSIKESLYQLINNKDRNDYIFTSERGGKLTTRTAQKIFSNALKKTNIKKGSVKLCLNI